MAQTQENLPDLPILINSTNTLRKMTDLTDGKLELAKKFAESIKDETLQKCLDSLEQVEKNYAENGMKVQTNIFNDFAPLSFEFTRYEIGTATFLGNGGVIFHGNHDGYGSGQCPTFSVCLEPTTGWSIHT